MSRSLSASILGGILAALVLAASPAAAQPPADPASRAAVIAPLVDPQTVAVGRLDLRRLDAAPIVEALREIAPPEAADAGEQFARLEQPIKMVKTLLRSGGIEEVYTVISLSDVPQGPPLVAAPIAAGGDVAHAAEVLKELTQLPAAGTVGNLAVVGSAAAIERVKTHRPHARPELAKAFELAGNTTVQFIFAPTEDTRRVLREMLPQLPEAIGGGSGTTLADGLQWGVLSVDAPPNLSLKLTLQSKSADAAQALRGLIVSLLQQAGQQEAVKREVPEFPQLAALVTPQLRGDQLVVDLSPRDEQFNQALRQLVVRPLQAARQSASRMSSQNNLKQIGLALHNYHDVHARFPPQAIRSKEGRPLLSWRVAILPWIEQNALYEQFRLDEPWDSEHNRQLIAKMPAVFASPHLPDALRAKGMTTYVAPLSKAPAATFTGPPDDPRKPLVGGKHEMIFDLPQGTVIARIVDGTSNTILVVEAGPSAAVEWTRPADLVIAEKEPLKALLGSAPKGFSALFGDGSVRFVSENVDLKVLRRLLEMNDGEVVGEF